VSNHSKKHKQILNVIEQSLLDFITPQVIGISATTSLLNSVSVYIYIDGVLPEYQRRYLSIAAEDILIGPPRARTARIYVIDESQEPIAPIGDWVYRRSETDRAQDDD
jgi:hypothetical protein